MQIEVEADGNIEGSEELIAQVTDVVEGALSRMSENITRLSVHLRDENSDKKGGNEDIRCMIEADLEGRRPIAVTEHAATWEQALAGAAGKMANSIEGILGRESAQDLRAQEKLRSDPPSGGES
jgi:hypothetical protein